MQAKTPPERAALLIDGLGTLVALEPPAQVLRRELEQRFGVTVSDPQAQRALAAEIAFYRARMNDGRDADSLMALRRRCAEVLRDALPGSDRLAQVDTDSLTRALLASLRFTAFDDARDALLAARARRQRVIVVSNWDVSLLEVLELVGLAPLLHGVVTSAAVGARKPSPAIFEHALALAGTTPDRAVHVGDSLEEDVEGARGCGVSAILLRRDGTPGPAGVATIASLAQLACPSPA
jgi:putative hydrolase of the HAD superfamily